MQYVSIRMSSVHRFSAFALIGVLACASSKDARPTPGSEAIPTDSQTVGMSTLPAIQVDPETYTVIADGEVLRSQPAHVLPLAQRYFLF